MRVAGRIRAAVIAAALAMLSVMPALARAEYEVFQRFAKLTRGRMAVLISHRFSTVRMADRILVLQGGAVGEQGSHEEIVSLAGHYAELFELQAA
jgi:ATP-binding cassette subfamily B protein